jgi:uncharacterized protein (DUF2461 family)
LKKGPVGFPCDHSCIEDLRRTDFIAVGDLSEKEAVAKNLLDKVDRAFIAAKPFMRFLCDALRVPF